MADDYIQNDRKQLYAADICDIYCVSKALQACACRAPVMELASDSNGREILSILDLIEAIVKHIHTVYPDIQVVCESVGAQQVMIERKQQVKEKWWLTCLKTGFVSLTVFTGAAFTIMTYDQDVDVTGVFGHIYQLTLGEIPAQPGILEAAYAIGIAVGIFIFFNPFTASRQRKEPSPIEIEMEKYESDIQDTILKMDQRSSGGR
jgi:stage V sporulation protein AA